MFKLEPFAVQGSASLGLVLMLAPTANMAADQDIIESVVQPVLAGGSWPDSDAPRYRTANQSSYIHGSRCHLIEMLEDIYVIALPYAAGPDGDLCAPELHGPQPIPT